MAGEGFDARRYYCPANAGRDAAGWVLGALSTPIKTSASPGICSAAAALPVFRTQGSGHFITVGSTAAYKWVPGQAVYAATKSAVRALCEVMRQELAPEGLRCTFVSPGFTDTSFISSTRDPGELASLTARRDAMAMPPQAVAETIAFAITQPDSIDIGEVIVRPTVQP